MLPNEMLPWRLVYHYFMRWRQDGRWLLMHDALRDALRHRSGKKKPPGLRYSTHRVLNCANHRESRGYDAGKKILGRKRHLVVDTRGLILGVLFTPANVSDPAGATQLLPEVVARFKDNPLLWGSFVWCMFDFQSARRHEGGLVVVNDKGLVTENRKIKKDVYSSTRQTGPINRWSTSPPAA